MDAIDAITLAATEGMADFRKADDFLDPRSRTIVRTYDLLVAEILPGYLGLEKRLHDDHGKIIIPSDAPLNIHAILIREAMCAAAVNYEFCVRDRMILPGENGRPQLLSRTQKPERYESRARSMEKLVDSLRTHQKTWLDDVLGE